MLVSRHQIFETDSCIAILDAFPAVTGHALLISKAPASTIMDLTEQQAADVLKELPRLCRAVQKVFCNSALHFLKQERIHFIYSGSTPLRSYTLSLYRMFQRSQAPSHVRPTLVLIGHRKRRRECAAQRRRVRGASCLSSARARGAAFCRRWAFLAI